MRKIFYFFILVNILSVNRSKSQDIAYASVLQGNRITIRDKNNNELSYKYLSINETLLGFSTSLIVIQSGGGRVVVYDQRFNGISYKYLNGSDQVKAVNGDYIVVKNSSGRVTIYNKNFSEISYRYEN